jgi:hypothetical protein
MLKHSFWRAARRSEHTATPRSDCWTWQGGCACFARRNTARSQGEPQAPFETEISSWLFQASRCRRAHHVCAPRRSARGKPIKMVNFKGFLGHKVILFNGGKASRTVSDVMPALLLWTRNPIERSRRSSQPRLLVRHQRLREVREEVVWVFDANREADRRISDAHANAQLAGYARMRCAARMAG